MTSLHLEETAKARIREGRAKEFNEEFSPISSSRLLRAIAPSRSLHRSPLTKPNPLRIGIHIHALLAHEPNQRLPALLRELHGEARRRRHRRDDRHAPGERLLHDLEARSPADDQDVTVE